MRDRRWRALKRWAAKHVAGPYRLLQAAHTSTTYKWLQSAPAYPLDRWRQRRNDGIFAFEIFSTMGLGAMLTHTVKLLKFADDNGLTPAIAFTNPLYADTAGSDWFADYFELHTASHRGVLPDRLSFLRIAHEYSMAAFAVPTHMDLSEARRVFCKYVSIRPIIYQTVRELTDGLPGGQFDISIHYRGTDKIFEAAPVAYETVVATVQRATGGAGHAFLATDDAGFATFIKEQFPSIRFTSFDLASGVQEAGEPRHFSAMRGGDKAREALVNIVAIGQSPVCIRTCSHLSAWARSCIRTCERFR